MLLYIGLFLIGLGVGIGLAILIFRPKSIGSLLMMPSDEGDPYLFLELTTEPHVVARKKYVTMKVNSKNQLSHK